MAADGKADNEAADSGGGREWQGCSSLSHIGVCVCVRACVRACLRACLGASFEQQLHEVVRAELGCGRWREMREERADRGNVMRKEREGRDKRGTRDRGKVEKREEGSERCRARESDGLASTDPSKRRGRIGRT